MNLRPQCPQKPARSGPEIVLNNLETLLEATFWVGWWWRGEFCKLFKYVFCIKHTEENYTPKHLLVIISLLLCESCRCFPGRWRIPSSVGFGGSVTSCHPVPSCLGGGGAIRPAAPTLRLVTSCTHSDWMESSELYLCPHICRRLNP